MSIIINDDISKIYYNYFNGNYNSIEIDSDIIIKNGKKYLKKKINIDFNDNIQDDIKEQNIKMSKLANLIIEHFLISNNIVSYGMELLSNKDCVTIENDKGQTLSVSSPSIKLEYPSLLEILNKVNVVSIDNDEIDNINIYSYYSEISKSKTLIYNYKSKTFTIIIRNNSLEYLDDIIDLVNYFIIKNRDYYLRSTDIINIEDGKLNRKYRFSNDKQLCIKGRELIKIIERRLNNEGINNGKTGKSM